MRKYKLFLAVLLSAAVLTGCERTSGSKIPEFSFSSAISESYPESSSSQNFSSAESEADSLDEEVPEKIEGEYKIVLDPANERTVVCDKNKIILTGRVSGGFKPSLNIPHTEKYVQSGESFTYTAVLKDGYTGYGNLTVFKNCYVRIYADKGEAVFVENAESLAENEKAVKNAIVQPLSQVSEYIAINADKEKIAEVLEEITKISNKICEGLTNDYDKLRAISNWVSANIYYDYAAFDAGVPANTLTLEYMLSFSSSVCGGYSNMTSALAAVQGIKVYNVHGSAVNNHLTFGEREPGYHEWNYAVLDGRVIWIDAGWNSHCVRYADSRGYVSGEVTAKYFDITAEALSQNHRAKYAEYRDYFALLEE